MILSDYLNSEFTVYRDISIEIGGTFSGANVDIETSTDGGSNWNPVTTLYSPGIYRLENDDTMLGRVLVNNASLKTDIYVKELPKTRHIDVLTGRAYFYTNNRWVTYSHASYGFNFYNWTQSGGTGATPTLGYSHMGNILEPGRKIKNISITGRMNNTEVTDVELYIVLVKPDDPDQWLDGFNDSDTKDNVILVDENWDGGSFTGDLSTYTHKRKIEINHLVTEAAFLSVYFKPVGTITATRYFTTVLTFEFE